MPTAAKKDINTQTIIPDMTECEWAKAHVVESVDKAAKEISLIENGSIIPQSSADMMAEIAKDLGL